MKDNDKERVEFMTKLWLGGKSVLGKPSQVLNVIVRASVKSIAANHI